MDMFFSNIVASQQSIANKRQRCKVEVGKDNLCDREKFLYISPYLKKAPP